MIETTSFRERKKNIYTGIHWFEWCWSLKDILWCAWPVNGQFFLLASNYTALFTSRSSSQLHQSATDTSATALGRKYDPVTISDMASNNMLLKEACCSRPCQPSAVHSYLGITVFVTRRSPPGSLQLDLQRRAYTEIVGSNGLLPKLKSWALTFLMRGFGLSKKLSIEVGFAFYNKCLKSQDLQFRIKKNIYIFLPWPFPKGKPRSWSWSSNWFIQWFSDSPLTKQGYNRLIPY